MKLFKSILAVMAIAVTLSLASCGSDNDGDGPDGDDSLKSKIVGTWVYYDEYYDELDYDFVCEFESNGRFAELEKGRWDYGKYTITGDILRMYYDGEDYDWSEYAYLPTYKILSLTSTKMVLKEAGDNDEGDVYTWYKED